MLILQILSCAYLIYQLSKVFLGVYRGSIELKKAHHNITYPSALFVAKITAIVYFGSMPLMTLYLVIMGMMK